MKKRLLTMLLALTLVLGMLPAGAAPGETAPVPAPLEDAAPAPLETPAPVPLETPAPAPLEDAAPGGQRAVPPGEESGALSTTRPAQGTGAPGAPYQIATAPELAWLAAEVKAGREKTASAVLTDNIHLGDAPWTPIGTSYSASFGGSFDGGGFTVSGLNVTATTGAVGLFGYVKGTSKIPAVVQNLTVAGSVTTTGGNDVGGLMGHGEYVQVTNCHNQAAVTVTGGSGQRIGGVIGYLYDGGSLADSSNTGSITAPASEAVGGVVGAVSIFGGTTPVSACFNRGDIVGKAKVGGVAGKLGASARDLYNTGGVIGTTVVGGIAGDQSGALSRAYTVGTVGGTAQAQAVLGKASASYGRENLYYLESLLADASATPQTQAQLQALAGTLGGAWKSDGQGANAVNGGYPVLAWQEVTASKQLAPPTNTVWSAGHQGALTPVVTWDEVAGAVSYTVKLWDFTEREVVVGTGEQQHTETVNELVLRDTVTGVTANRYDFTAKLAQLGSSTWYYATVTALGDGATTTDSAESAIDYYNGKSCLIYALAVSPPTALRWTGPVANWAFSEFAAGYRVLVYRLNEQNEPAYMASGVVGPNVNTLDCSRYFAVGGRYVFGLVALSEDYVRTGDETLNSPESPLSNHEGNQGAAGVYTAVTPTPPTPGDDTGWVLVTTAEQLVALANVKDEPVDSAHPNTSKQAVEWGKKYRLKADLDFSALSAQAAAKSKSIGNLKYPFTGSFDGNGHKITGLTLSNLDTGLFAYLGSAGTVCDLTIAGGNVLFADNAAVLVMNNRGCIERCGVINTNITADTGAVLGGMVSRNYGIVRDSYVLGGTLRSNSNTATGHAGFVGSNEAGGLIERCYSTMAVESGGRYAGGFVGLAYGGTIRNCFALGDVRADGYSGGFAGRSVYDGNLYENCYATGTVTVKTLQGNGFVGGSAPDSAFQPDLSKEMKNCYFSSDTGKTDGYATGKTTAELKTTGFLAALGGTSGVWASATDQNGGLPYLTTVTPPAPPETQSMTVTLGLATYDRTGYGFKKMGPPITVTLESTGNTRVIDVLDAAAAQHSLTYSYDVTATFGRYIRTINGHTVDAPDGWMFTVNEKRSNLSASLATVENGGKILWYEGTTENHFSGPTWAELTDTPSQWQDIATVAQLEALAATTDDTALAGHYRLTGALDLQGVAFAGVGTAAHPFTGSFDGGGFAVTHLRRAGTENVGLFNVAQGATIKNLALENAQVTGTKNVGALVGCAMAVLDKNDMGASRATLVGNCTATGTVVGQENVGGLVGLNQGQSDQDTGFSIASAVNKCAAQVAVTGGGTAAYVGGLVGRNDGYLTQSTATGDVRALDGTMAGGLVGGGSGGIYDSSAQGDVTAAGNAGGLIGFGGSGAVGKNCYALGAVAASDGNVGGLAGAFSGTLEGCMSAGRVTPSAGLSAYSGGLIGSFSGLLAGPEHKITLKNSFANCTQGGAALKALGNAAAFQGEQNQAALAQMQLTSHEAVSAKLRALFGVNMKVPAALVAEAEKYAPTLGVDYGTTSPLCLLKAGETADGSVTTAYTVLRGEDYLTGGSALVLKKQNTTCATVTAQVQLTLTDSTGNLYTKQPLTVLLKTAPDGAKRLMDAIAGASTEKSDSWYILDMAAYAALPGTTARTTADARQAYVNTAITALSGDKVSASDRAKHELALRAIGGDTTRLYPVNSNTPLNNAAALAGMDLKTLTAYGYYAVPWILMAELQGNVVFSTAQREGLLQLLADNQGAGLFGYTWGGVTYADMDTTGAVLAALAHLYGSNPAAKTMVDKALVALSAAQGENGSFGNANTDAILITGLTALGIDPGADPRFVKNGVSLLDGLLTNADAAGTGFLYLGKPNGLATEQGFRALVAAPAGAPAYQIYDFSAVPALPLRATGAGGGEAPVDPPEENPSIAVTLTLKTDSAVWIPTTTLTLKEGATVYHALTKALKNAGMTSVGAESGYVRAVTKNGVTLSEFDKGPNSGWLYQVNGVAPGVGLTSCTLKDGDKIAWYFTTDWTAEPDAGAPYPVKPNQPQPGTLTPGATANQSGAAHVTVTQQELECAVAAVVEGKLSALVIRPALKGEVAAVRVTVPKAGLGVLAAGGGALAVSTPVASLRFSPAALRTLAGQPGEQVDITVEKIAAATRSQAQQALVGDCPVYTLSVRVGTTEIAALGVTVSLPYTPKPGEDVRRLTAYDLGQDGRPTEVAGAHYDAATVSLVFETTRLSTFALGERAPAFTDVNPGDWCFEAVRLVTQQGLFTGVTEQCFAPDQAMSRAMLWTVLYRRAGAPGRTEQALWYADAQAWAVATHLTDGARPQAPVTRQEVAVMLYRAAAALGQDVSQGAALGQDVSQGAALGQFTDAAAVPQWAATAMGWAVGSGLLTGRSATLLAPDGTASRGETAAIFSRMAQSF